MSEEMLFRTEDDVLTITVNRPEVMNAVDGPMLHAAADAVEQTQARVIVITGSGRAFGAGADLNRVKEGGTQEGGNRLVRAMLSTPRPVVAAVNGPAAGISASVALAADFTVAHESAYFLQAFINIGLMPDGGGTQLVAASLGRARANRMAMLGERLPAAEAAEAGLIEACLADEEYPDGVVALVKRLASGPTAAYAETKAALNAVTLAGIDETLQRELDGQERLGSTDDFHEGVTAFLAKRPATFEGR
ncbi:enoyl-CoA hydratase-related protein [Aeromicrobium sp. CTD01-1L150]|uniref:enoyl-CoA hydratase-related protein n=1 Tax=Aeromicrobium sp. CTD01-1L150 TaxID=3341830 RepID=UPI0035C0AFB6